MPDYAARKKNAEGNALYACLCDLYETLRQEPPFQHWAVEAQYERMCDHIDDALTSYDAMVADEKLYGEVWK